jgi:hypothetical protein
MTKSKLYFTALCVVAMAFVACKKNNNNNNNTSSNSFTVNGQTYQTNNAFIDVPGNDPGTFSAVAITNLPSFTATASNVNAVQIVFPKSQFPTSGTFTYKNITANGAGYDSTKDLSDVYVGFKGNFDPANSFTGGTQYDSYSFDATGSTVTVSKSGNTYTFNYNLKFTTGSNVVNVTGNYSGTPVAAAFN